MKEKDTTKWYRRLNPFKSKVVDQDEHSSGIRLVLRPLRIFQFLVVLLIFVLVIYTIATSSTKVSSITCLLLIVLSGVYVFVLAIELISQFSNGELYEVPIFYLSFLGAILFGVAGIFLIPIFIATKLWYIITMLCFCLLACILFLIDVMIILVLWRRSCNVCNRCTCNGHHTDNYFKDENYCHPLCNTVKYDLMTSVSSIRVPSGDEDGIPEHCYRKMGCARRRQYVDRPTSARSKSALDIAKCQTEQPMMCSMQCQTQQNVVETPVQTVSKCELCNRQMQVFSPAMEVPLAGQHPAPCVPCPALLQLFRGAPCCPGCRCVAGIVQVPQQSQHQQTQRQDQEQPTTNDVQWVQQDQKSYGMLTNEQRESKMSGVSGTITKLTLASYCVTPSKKTDISSQTTDDEMSVGRKISETSEQKKQRASVQTVPKEKVRESSSMESESLEQHKGKAKTSVSSEKEASKPSARKSSLKSSSSKAGSKRPSEDQKPSEPAPDVSQDVYEEQSEMVVPAADPALVPPPQKVAQMITLLQEIEGGKGSDDADKVATEASKVEEGKIFGVEASVETSILMEESEIGVDIHENVKEAAAEEIEDTKEEIKEEDKDEVKKKANDEGKQEAREEAKEEHKEKDNEKAKEKAKKENTVEAREEVTEGVKKQIDRPVKEGGITICELKKECLPTPKEAHKKAKKRADSDSTSSDASTGSINESVKSKAEVLSLSRLSTGRERQSMRTTSTTKPDAETQAIDIDLSFNKTKKMSFLKKRNKVEPAEIVTADTDVQTWFSEDHSDEVVSEGIKPDVEKFIADKRGIVGEMPVCPSCKRLQYFPTTTSFLYYSVYRDKRGRLFCDNCSTTTATMKVLYRQEANDLKRLRCTRCGNSLRQKSSRSEGPYTRNRNDSCPKCTQMPMRTHSIQKK